MKLYKVTLITEVMVMADDINQAKEIAMDHASEDFTYSGTTVEKATIRNTPKSWLDSYPYSRNQSDKWVTVEEILTKGQDNATLSIR